jgi:hypothetical protein
VTTKTRKQVSHADATGVSKANTHEGDEGVPTLSRMASRELTQYVLLVVLVIRATMVRAATTVDAQTGNVPMTFEMQKGEEDPRANRDPRPLTMNDRIKATFRNLVGAGLLHRVTTTSDEAQVIDAVVVLLRHRSSYTR